ncbi:hypothetical protein HJD18_03430 [Thermoleophilia bacterium SCSIO 60948]|nr:hypothetical protein HJD18_03430 [Thermoleophilia bacterium SCSIO 60948]
MNEAPERDLPALEAVGERLVGVARSRRRDTRMRLAATFAATVVVVGFSTLTAPGQHAVAWVGDLVGGSDEIQPQTVDERLRDAVSIGAGEVPSGAQFELFADYDEDEGMCAYFLWSEELGWGSCESEIEREGDEVSIARVDGADPEALTVSGYAPADANSIEITYASASGAEQSAPDATLFETTPAQLREIGAPPSEDFGLFVAQIPNGVGEVASGLDVRVSALRNDEVIDSAPIAWIQLGSPGGEPDYAECTGEGPFAQFCERAEDAALQEREFFRRLTSQSLSPELIDIAGAAGLELAEPTPEQRLEVSAFSGGGELPDLFAMKLINRVDLGPRGSTATYFASLDGSPVYVVFAASDSPEPGRPSVYDELPVGPRTPEYRRAAIGVFDAITGDVVEVVPVKR